VVALGAILLFKDNQDNTVARAVGAAAQQVMGAPVVQLFTAAVAEAVLLML
jgi:hypothetical protein